MNLLDKFAINSYLFFCNQKEKVKEAFLDETGAVDIVAIVVMIGIAVIIAVVFKEQIKTLIVNLFGTITGNATNAVNGN